MMTGASAIERGSELARSKIYLLAAILVLRLRVRPVRNSRRCILSIESTRSLGSLVRRPNERHAALAPLPGRRARTPSLDP
jgi:hypothetical protein